MQKIFNERKQIKFVEVDQENSVFMICFEQQLEVYNNAKSNNDRKWNLWKKMFTKDKDRIKTATMITNAK